MVFLWSRADPAGAAMVIAAVPAIRSGAVEAARAALHHSGLAAALLGGFQGMPFKVWSAAAPHDGWSPLGWALAAFPIRLPRFILTAVAFGAIGGLLRPRLGMKVLAVLFVVGWLAFYAIYWSMAQW